MNPMEEALQAGVEAMQATRRVMDLSMKAMQGTALDREELRQLGEYMARHPEFLRSMQETVGMIEVPEGREALNTVLARAQAAVR